MQKDRLPSIHDQRQHSNCVSHLSAPGGVHNALLEARRLGLHSVELFAANQRQLWHPPLPENQVDHFQQTHAKTVMNIVIADGSYLVNPGSPP